MRYKTNLFVRFGFLLVLFVSEPALAKCLKFSCDPSIKYAMGRERMILTLRLGQLTNSVVQMAVETDKTTKLMTKEALQLLRLRERYAIRTYNIMREGYHVRRELEGVLEMIDIQILLIQSKEGRFMYSLIAKNRS